MGSGAAHQLNSGPGDRDPASCSPAALMGLVSGGESAPRGSMVTQTPHHRDFAQFKKGDNDQCTFFSWGMAETPAVLACCQDSSLKTHQFPFISKIGPQAFNRVRMCDNYSER